MANMLTHTPAEDSHVAHIAYDPDTRYLHLRFRNKLQKVEQRTYTYAGVPLHVFEAMTKHSSAGTYFHRVIKRHYKMV